MWIYDSFGYFLVFETGSTWKMREILYFFSKFGTNSLTGQRCFDWSNIQKFWLVNDWLTSHKVSTLAPIKVSDSKECHLILGLCDQATIDIEIIPKSKSGQR